MFSDFNLISDVIYVKISLIIVNKSAVCDHFNNAEYCLTSQIHYVVLRGFLQ